jgi:hypothetical protein
MNEDQVLQSVIQWFVANRSTSLYQTRPIAEGAIAGVDAILFSQQHQRYTFIDAKGAAATPVARATAFSNSLGSLIKRIRIETGYSGFGAAARFTPPESRATIATAARHRVSDYVLALTPDYEETVRTALDPALASLLHIRVLIVEPDFIREYAW